MSTLSIKLTLLAQDAVEDAVITREEFNVMAFTIFNSVLGAMFIGFVSMVFYKIAVK